MRLEVLAETMLVGSRSYARGDHVDVPDDVHARALVKQGHAAVAGDELEPRPVERAEAPRGPESASADPGKRRRV